VGGADDGAGRVGVLVINLVIATPAIAAAEVSDDEWDKVFMALVGARCSLAAWIPLKMMHHLLRICVRRRQIVLSGSYFRYAAAGFRAERDA
jgi:NAD(P)-dependent dehydrogenase (short-subunit alcohol dehydrogenase family)